MKYLHRLFLVASAAFFIATSAFAQSGTVTQHAFAIGKGAGVTGYSSALCTAAQLAIGQSAADPLCKTITGDVTLSAAGATTLATVNSNVGSFGSATSCPTFTVNGKGLITAASAATCTPAIGSITGLGTGVATALGVNVGSAGAFVTFNGALGTPSSGTATNLTGTAAGLTAGHVTTNANMTGDVTSVGNATTIAANAVTNAKMATMAANTVKANATGSSATPTDVTAATARSSSLLNVDSFTGHGDSIYTILSTDRTVGTNAAFTASRTWTLPAANAVNPGQEIIVADFQGTVTGTNTLVISRAGSDTVNGVTSVTISSANGAYLLKSDGTSKWTAQALGAAAAGGVSSVTCGTGLSGGTITTSGTCAVSLTTVTNSIGSNVSLPNGTYVDGPSVAQGTSGTWFASGTVSLTAGAAAEVWCKLWDGTSIISTGTGGLFASGARSSIALSGTLSSPAANIRISCLGNGGTATMEFNRTGNSKDSTLTAVRTQ